MKSAKHLMLILFIVLLQVLKVQSQNCGITNPSFESFSSCPTSHSQFNGYVDDWQNALSVAASTPDYFNSSCGFDGFVASGITIRRKDNNNGFFPKTGCGYAGLFLNYNDGTQDPKYREYIMNRVDLVAGRTYQLELDLATSNHSISNNLEADFGIYGYTGIVPASQIDFCIVDGGGSPIPMLASVPKANIGSSLTRKTVTFTPGINHDYIVLGGSDCGTDATDIGYVFIDRVVLTDVTDDVTLTPVIEKMSGEVDVCCASSNQDEFTLQGNEAPTGTIISWGQSASNPMAVTFDAPNADSTGIIETGDFPAGTYEFTYTFEKGGCTMTDKIQFVIKSLGPVDVNAGADLEFCQTDVTGPEGNTPATIVQRDLLQLNALPNNTDIVNNDYITWWTFILEDNTEWLIGNNCITPSSLGYDGYSWDTGYFDYNQANVLSPCKASSDLELRFLKGDNHLKFVWHVQADECAEILTDTINVTQHDIDFPESNTVLEPYAVVGLVGQTIKLPQAIEANNNFYYNFETLKHDPNFTLDWVQLSGPGTISFLDTEVKDTFSLTADFCGDYHIRLTINDSESGCSFYDETWIKVADLTCLDGSAIDVCPTCDGTPTNNDSSLSSNYALYSGRSVRMDANINPEELTQLGLQSYWSLIQSDGSEWIFPNDCIADNGIDQGDVFVHNYSGIECSSIEIPSTGYPNSPNAYFKIRNPIDSLSFVWHIIDPNTGTHLRDTVSTCIKDVDFKSTGNSNPFTTICNGETAYIHQNDDADFRKLKETDGDLSFLWTQESGPGTLNILNQGVADSLQVTGTIGGTYVVRLTVTDNESGCKWFDETYIQIVESFTVNAGSDKSECNSSIGNSTTVSMTASPNNIDINSNNLCTWWSLIQPNGTEYIFSNDCGIAYDGNDAGDVHTNNSYNGASQTFTFRNVGDYEFIWNVQDPCTGTVLKDTVAVSVGYTETGANAGNDITTTSCNTIALLGNVSDASAANTGCYQWTQISGPGTLNILDAQSNVAYVVGLENTPIGTYVIEYEIGCNGGCTVVDQMELTVTNPLPVSTVTLSSDDTDVCFGDGETVTFTAGGADQYTFLINGEIVQDQSPSNTFIHSSFIETSLIEVIGFHTATGCLDYTNSSESITITVDAGPTPILVGDPSGDYCSDETIDLQATAPGYNIKWFTTPNPLTGIPLNGPDGTPSGDIYTISPLVHTTYYGYSFDPTGVECLGNIPLIVNIKVWDIPSLTMAEGDSDPCTVSDAYLTGRTINNERLVIWYDNPEGIGTPINPGGTISNGTFVIPSLDSSAVYYAFALDTLSGCHSQTGIEVTIPLIESNPPVNLTAVKEVFCSGVDYTGPYFDMEVTAELEGGIPGNIVWYSNNTASGQSLNSSFTGTPVGEIFSISNYWYGQRSGGSSGANEFVFYAFDKFALESGCELAYDSIIIKRSTGPQFILDDVYACAEDNIDLNSAINNMPTDLVTWYLEGDLVNPLNPGGTPIDAAFNYVADISLSGSELYAVGTDSLGCLTDLAYPNNETNLFLGIIQLNQFQVTSVPDGGVNVNMVVSAVGSNIELTWDDGMKDTINIGTEYTFPFPCDNTIQNKSVTFRDILYGCTQTVPFDINPCITFGDKVWLDDDLDGIIEEPWIDGTGTDRNSLQDPGEPGVEGVMVLLIYDAGPFSWQDTTYTDSNGNYSFTISDSNTGGFYINIDPSTNTSGYTDLIGVSSNQGSDDSIDSDNYGTSFYYDAQDLDDLDNTLDFGLQRNATTFQGYAWFDEDADGGFDSSEIPLENVRVELYYDPITGPLDTLIVYTDDTGLYTFSGIPAHGDFRIFMNPGTNVNGLSDLVVTPALGPNDPNWIVQNSLSQDSTLGVWPYNFWAYYTIPGGGLNGGFVKDILTIKDFVWEDLNANGEQDAGEPGIPGVTITAWVFDGITWTDLVSMTTDSDGLYSLEVPNHLIYEEIIVVFDETTNTAGLTNLVFSPQQGGAELMDQFVNTASEVKVDGSVYAGGTEIKVSAFPSGSTAHVDAGLFSDIIYIEDFVWNDLNKNGIQDLGEPGIEGVTVNLMLANGDLIESVDTDANGLYSFNVTPSSLPQIPLIVTFDPTTNLNGLTDLTLTLPNTGFNDEKDSDISHQDFQFQSYYIEFYENYGGTFGVDAGLYEYLPTDILVVEDYVWYDSNENGIQDITESGLPGVEVEVYFNGNLEGSTTTDANGFYRIEISQLEGNPVTNYITSEEDLAIKFTPPALVSQEILGATTANVPSDESLDSDIELMSLYGELVYGAQFPIIIGTITDIDAGFIPAAVTIGDFVWMDQNDNGLQDPNEPGIEGMEISFITLNQFGDPVHTLGTAITDENGYYEFTIDNPITAFPLQPVIFMIFNENSNSLGYNLLPVPNQQGSDPLLDSDYEEGIFGEIAEYVIEEVQAGATYNVDAGFKTDQLLIQDHVWLDLDEDGIQDAGEPGLPNYEVTLWYTETQGNGDVYLEGDFYQTTTNNAGDFSILVDEGDLSGWNSNHNFFVSFESLLPMSPPPAVPVSLTITDAGSDDTVDSDVSIVTFDDGALGPDAEVLGYTIPKAEFEAGSGAVIDIDAGFINTSDYFIFDYVWEDLNEDGIQDSNEPGIEGTKVFVYIINSDMTLTLFNAMSTDEAGKYLFQLNANDIADIQSDPTSLGLFVRFDAGGLGATLQNALSNDLVDSDVALTLAYDGGKPYVGYSIPLADIVGGSYRDIDAGFVNQDIFITGLGWNDENMDGIQNATEVITNGAQVELLLVENGVSTVYSSQPFGIDFGTNEYEIGIKLGDAEDVESDPNKHWEIVISNIDGDLLITQDNQGTDLEDSDVIASVDYNDSNGYYTIPDGLVVAGARLDYDAGFIDGKMYISGFVWEDADKAGDQDGNETPIEKAEVNLYTELIADNINSYLNTATETDGTYQIVLGVKDIRDLLDQINSNKMDALFLDINPESNANGFTDLSMTITDDLTVGDLLDSDIDVNVSQEYWYNNAGGLGLYAMGKYIPLSEIRFGNRVTPIDGGFYSSPLKISGRAWYETDADGIQDLGEIGLEDVFVTVYESIDGTPAGDDLVNLTTPTSGSYSSDLPLSTAHRIHYRNAFGGETVGLSVAVHKIENNANGIADLAPSEVDAGSDDAIDSDMAYWSNTAVWKYIEGADIELRDMTAVLDAGFHTGIWVGGRAWLELDTADGIQNLPNEGIDNGTPLIPIDSMLVEGITIELYDQANNLVSATQLTTTGDDSLYPVSSVGDYKFLVSKGYTYTFKFTGLPANYLATWTNYGGDDAFDSDMDQDTYMIEDIYIPKPSDNASLVNLDRLDAGFYDHTYTDLPVEMSYFQGYNKDCSNFLYWGTASELTNSHFVILRSEDGREFEEIGRIEGNGTTVIAQDYSFEDNNIGEGTYFYQLKQVDYNGDYSYTDIVVIHSNCIVKLGEIKLYPNPVMNSNVTLEYQSDKDLEAICELYSVDGKMMKSIDLSITTGFNKIRLDIDDLPTGHYYVRLTEGNYGTEFLKLIVVRP